VSLFIFQKARMDCEILIVGAGPTGLVLALWLTKLGVKLRIIDKAAEPGTTSRALAIHARTIELYRQLDLADSVVAKGHKVPAVNLWIKGAPEARIAFDKAGEGMTPYPFLHIFPQDEHEKLLIAKLEDRGVRVERNTTLTGYEEREKSVLARLLGPDGTVEDCEAAYIAGCDGAHSTVRETMGAGFPGGTYEHLFYVADIEASGPPVDGELHVDLDEADFLAIFPLADRDRVRLVGSVRAAAAAHSSGLQFSDVNTRAIDHLKIRIERINWFSTYRVHHRVASHFRKGRAFVLGDAGHIHSPAGGQGMNTGIGDAINLAWKLKWVLAGLAPDSLLDSYEGERMPFALRLVNTTDRAFSLATKEGTLADFTRTRIAPFALPPLFRLALFRDFAFRAVSQISISYRHCSLNEGKAGAVRGGDRLPWVAGDFGDNYEFFDGTGWQVHSFGETDAGLVQWGEARKTPVRSFPWRPEFEKAGLASDVAFLLRPDSYVALASPSRSVQYLERYFAERSLRPAELARFDAIDPRSPVA
jgi:2-polyprenyl-6-methoxyphenol hydroxylase-like FAD-dependent oxidoreductase